MAIKTINVEMLAKMFLAGAQNIEAKKEFINELNVFPVPDGDTGTNMSLTIMAAAKEVTALENMDVTTLAKAISSGSLRGARGNSGVILSQLLRGFTKSIREESQIDVPALARAVLRAKDTAYKAVMKPKEGTILTVARGISDKAQELVEETDDLEVFIPKIIEEAEAVLARTPDMLPVLKEAGVVDSGGQGLLEVIKGAYDAFLGKEIDYSAIAPSSAVNVTKINADSSAEIKFGYCTEFIILTEKEFTEDNEMDFKAYLESIGDSIVCVADEDVVKVHVHTNDPGLAIQKALTFGQLSRMKIDNMREEHQEKLIKDAQKLAQAEKENKKKKEKEARKPVGFIAVSIGEGLNEIFRELGVDYIIEGGQTMNPSTDDMLNAIDEVNADTIFILPNNKNIVLAANQARDLMKEKDIIVIPTKTVPQGITAVINFNPEADVDTNEETMLEEIKNVKTGQVTYAVRDTHIDDKEIHEGDIMGIGDAGILSVGTSIEDTAKDMLAQLVEEESELISLYYGEDVSEEEAEKFVAEIEENYPDMDVDAHKGGQPIYYYILAVE
ncbi:DAK2 domain-containing protein [Bariatricus massiliensis]|uniref:DAK2 domain-containing protein n=1 Tax=Bariatricus massiliensis TaxID=1745713 RepID=A0ABS8DCU2_9FIRM|nr:DAK2 domain-containing protein [Bariatricus massiliensis]MCB7303438.1 DAK2 domain-containing protein [Bariatricus massiliensis]MCB7373570.1 DAK2 domain-containing protein [Bariatricus massiliensis]MCB7386240.1 DAK2 domain-containing protein [Bariatricus massiliensis]MCB7410402.1 DAK2 domain-containing protein [Bariatricus massiliensis]MCQ5252314.1 DAK2 domain-containing protein [Bariatricus massiliensis]